MTNETIKDGERATLLPCPFCGGDPHIEVRDVEPQGDPWYGTKTETFVLCECGACLFDGTFHEGFIDAAKAAKAWNDRAASPQSGERNAHPRWKPEAQQRIFSFYEKHALPHLAAPSCLVCGQSTQEVEPAITHMELPSIVVCCECHARAAAPQAALTDEQIEKAALEFVKKPGMQGYVEPADLIDFARGLLTQASTERMSDAALTPEVRAALNSCINYAQAAGWEPADVARQWLDSKSPEPNTDTVQPFIIEEGERDGNWREFSVNGHGGFIRVVARMEDDGQDLPLGKQVAQWILSGLHSDKEKSDERVSLTYVEQEALRAFAGRILEAQEQPIAVSLRAAELIHKVLDNAVSPQAAFTDEQIALAKNIAMHADEASILAGNDVCRAIMKKCAETIRALLNQTGT